MVEFVFFVGFFQAGMSAKCAEEVNLRGNWGKKIGVLTPATNLTVENELWSMCVSDATIATARIPIDKVEWNTDQDLEDFVKGVMRSIPLAADLAKQVQPDALLLAISISNLWGGLKSNADIKSQIKERSGVELFTPVDAMREGLAVFSAKKIGVVTPYPEIADRKVEDFFEELDIEVLAQEGLRCKSSLEIGEVPPLRIKRALEKVRVEGIDAIAILGTDLKVARLVAEYEDLLGVPIVAVNICTWWFTLRSIGIPTRMKGFGALLEKY
jgi:maleate isomerase